MTLSCLFLAWRHLHKQTRRRLIPHVAQKAIEIKQDVKGNSLLGCRIDSFTLCCETYIPDAQLNVQVKFRSPSQECIPSIWTLEAQMKSIFVNFARQVHQSLMRVFYFPYFSKLLRQWSGSLQHPFLLRGAASTSTQLELFMKSDISEHCYKSLRISFSFLFSFYHALFELAGGADAATLTERGFHKARRSCPPTVHHLVFNKSKDEWVGRLPNSRGDQSWLQHFSVIHFSEIPLLGDRRQRTLAAGTLQVAWGVS